MQRAEHKYMPDWIVFRIWAKEELFLKHPWCLFPQPSELYSFPFLSDRIFTYTSFFFSPLFLLRLTVHVSPSGTACYITSMMFYVEIQLEKDGDVMDVKLAHFEEAPVVKLFFSVSHHPVVSHLASSCHVRKDLTSFWSSHTCKPVHDTSYLFRHLNLSPKLTTQLQILNTLVLSITVKVSWQAHLPRMLWYHA